MASQQLIIFKINGEDFGMNIDQVKEIVKPLDTYKIPNTPDYIKGLINLRGKVYTVFSLRKKFNLPDREYDENTKIIILNLNNNVGLLVDMVHEIVWADDENIEATPETLKHLDKKFIQGVYKTENRMVLILNLSEITAL